MSSHDDHAIETQPSISKMDVIWFGVALSLATFAFCFICFNSAFLEVGKGIWSCFSWII